MLGALGVYYGVRYCATVGIISCAQAAALNTWAAIYCFFDITPHGVPRAIMLPRW